MLATKFSAASLGVSSAAPPRLAVKKEAPAADDVDPRIAADAAAALATQKKADEKIQRDRAARQARADARGLTLEQLEREETLERVRKSQADAAAKHPRPLGQRLRSDAIVERRDSTTRDPSRVCTASERVHLQGAAFPMQHSVSDKKGL